MVFCFQNYSDLLWEKNVLAIERKLLKFDAEGKNFEITRTIYSKSEKSEQFWIFGKGRSINDVRRFLAILSCPLTSVFKTIKTTSESNIESTKVFKEDRKNTKYKINFFVIEH